MKIFEIAFWIFLSIVFYTYIGYGILLYFLVKIKEFFSKPKQVLLPPYSELPDVTILIAAYNEEDMIKEKMSNTLLLDYPFEKLKIIWVTDGCTDGTNRILSEYINVDIVYFPERGGKTAAIKRAMPFVSTPLVIFTDANTMLNSEAVKEIVKAFSESVVGCVAGEKRIASKGRDSASSGGEGIYWKYESALKGLDSRLCTAVGAAGELFAIRRELFETIENDTLLDDFVQSMLIVKKGYKTEYCRSAYAIEEGSYNMNEEKKRKVRIAAGGVQAVWRLRGLLNPFKYPLVLFQYLSHRVLRWTVTPVLLIALLPVNLFLMVAGSARIYTVLFILQVLFYILAFIGILVENKKIRNSFIFIPHYFLFMNINVFRGFIYLLRKSKGDGTWEKAKRVPK